MRTKEIATIYLAGLAQGIAFVAFPALGILFTSLQGFGLSNTGYGTLFVPQALLSIGGVLLSAGLIRRGKSKSVLLIGLLANLLSMGLLTASEFYRMYTLLLAATASLGFGFGLTVPVLYAVTAKEDSVRLGLHALLGLGTAVAPIAVALCKDYYIWWAFPTGLATLFLVILLLSANLSLAVSQEDTSTKSLSKRFWLFALLALLYGMIETTNGNWAMVYMRQYMDADVATSALALTTFWAMMTIGRIFFTATNKIVSEVRVYHLLPFVVAGAFVLLASLAPHHAVLAIIGLGLLGFGCSALLPLTLTIGDKEDGTVGLIVFYLVGYGLAAFGIGFLQDHLGLSLDAIFGVATITALAFGLLAAVVQEKFT